jgi:putative phosphoesterase
VKIALLSDIHGNAAALEVVLDAAVKADVKQLLCCGDYVGYYYDPDRVLDLLDKWSWQGVRGNHEDMLISWMNGNGQEDILARYGSGLSVAAALPQKTLLRLQALPDHLALDVAGRTVLLCHGAPWATDDYVYPDASPEKLSAMTAEGQNLVVYGHTHYPLLQRQGTSLLVNPGSVGQPRDRKPGACWALWNSETMEVELRREHYDVEPLLQQCAARDPQLPVIADMLTRTV